MVSLVLAVFQQLIIPQSEMVFWHKTRGPNPGHVTFLRRSLFISHGVILVFCFRVCTHTIKRDTFSKYFNIHPTKSWTHKQDLNVFKNKQTKRDCLQLFSIREHGPVERDTPVYLQLSSLFHLVTVCYSGVSAQAWP